MVVSGPIPGTLGLRLENTLMGYQLINARAHTHTHTQARIQTQGQFSVAGTPISMF